MKTQIDFYKIIFISIFVFYLNVAYFNRSFVGLEIFEYRLGEYMVFFGLLMSIYFFFSGNIKIKNNNIKLLYRVIIAMFLFSALINNANFLNTYTFKSSSYIWMISYLFLGLHLGKIEFKRSNYYILLGFAALFSYIFSTGNYPNFIIDFFKENSDKFQFTKASDSFHLIVITSLIINLLVENSNFKLAYVYSISFLYLPLLIYQSRGSFIGIIIFLIIETYYFRKFIKNNIKPFSLILLLSAICLTIGIFRISDKTTKELSEEPVKIISETTTRIVENKDTVQTFLSFYFTDGRLYSEDPTANWRLDIWQDVMNDLSIKNKNFSGYGYNEIIPVMIDGSAPGRLGKDGLNEHVHNYFFTMISRGGYIQLFVFLLFYYHLIRFWLSKTKNLRILTYIIPVFFVSSLDISMDGVHFPFIFFLTLGYILGNANAILQLGLEK